MPKDYEEPVAGEMTVADSEGRPVQGEHGEMKWGTRKHHEHVITQEGGSVLLPDGRQITRVQDLPSEAEYNVIHKRGADRREATGGRVRDAVSAPVVGSEPKSESKSR